ncbi:T9SS type A sorting domain-containing protein [Arenibacter sp. GZD96]|uniref:T9SS type A sorting domain-containing protein n=1 Tax=Aurantibrevibacter litoralis TaxID=3106030 RepID=UPI002AFE8C7E|nr:T9SS type A sorting domain-containing protein [Arenibacter sp. GZD-96]MEA1787153.1 T9SS type A sorting domain-containing protein [Arenibacter sp. GZD-96]
MKKLYFVFLFFTSALVFAQQQHTGDIDGLKIYPNPVTNGKVFISTPLNAPKKILILDVLGTQVLETTLLGTELNLYTLEPGIYVIRVFEKDKMATRKLIVK